MYTRIAQLISYIPPEAKQATTVTIRYYTIC